MAGFSEQVTPREGAGQGAPALGSWLDPGCVVLSPALLDETSVPVSRSSSVAPALHLILPEEPEF